MGLKVCRRLLLLKVVSGAASTELSICTEQTAQSIACCRTDIRGVVAYSRKQSTVNTRSKSLVLNEIVFFDKISETNNDPCPKRNRYARFGNRQFGGSIGIHFDFAIKFQ
jgi:hypothetical protein